MLKKLIERVFESDIAEAIVRERLRIWEAIFQNSSVKPFYDGNKTSHIIFIGEPKLKEIVLPEVPKGYKEPKNILHLEPVVHLSLIPGGRQSIEHVKVS